MSIFEIEGGRPLCGEVRVDGAKNAALPIMAAAILAHEPVRLEAIPSVTDVATLASLLRRLGLDVTCHRDGSLDLQTVDPRQTVAPYRLVRRMRASFCVLGPLLARRQKAIVPLPGGCNIGDRPVDLHLTGLAALGARLRIERGHVTAEADRLRGATIDLRGRRGPTVTGTANVLSTAVVAKGKTVIRGASREPEVVDLGNFLCALGARIWGLGSSTIEVDGVDGLGGATYRIIPDRIEAATLLTAAAITGGAASVTGVVVDHLRHLLEVLSQSGAEIQAVDNRVSLVAGGRPRPISVVARPYPGVPTDMQSQCMALATLADGRSTIRDEVFPERFLHVPELVRMGASIRRDGATAVVNGKRRLSGADVVAADLRASAALVLAGLAAEGVTRVWQIGHLDRGYCHLEDKLRSLGAQIRRLHVRAESHPDGKRGVWPTGRANSLPSTGGRA